jgi:hypothetical protein
MRLSRDAAARKRIVAALLALAVLLAVNVQRSHWIKKTAEDKVSEFLGRRLDVKIGSISGGVLRDMILQDVSFSSGADDGEIVFSVDRMEISYRIWWVAADKLGFVSDPERGLKYISVYFSRSNPFVRGFIRLDNFEDRIGLIGHVSPIALGDGRKRGVKGDFFRRPDGKYDCDISWDGSMRVAGNLDPAGRSIDLAFEPTGQARSEVKIKGAIDEENAIRVYTRLDKAGLLGNEIIGDLEVYYKAKDGPVFLFEAENLLVNRRPFWNIAVGGRFSREEKTLLLENAAWGDSFSAFGKIKTEEPYALDLKIDMRNMRIHEMAEMFGSTDKGVFGKADGEISFSGPAGKAAVKGRLYIGEGVLGGMEFKSLFATLGGKLPVIRVEDARAVKEGGNIVIGGEIDLSKMGENAAFQGMVFETDNRVAVWENWQIKKREKDNRVDATRDRITITTAIEDEDVLKSGTTRDQAEKEFGVKYKLDPYNSLKMDVDEDRDFFGVEHKIQF